MLDLLCQHLKSWIASSLLLLAALSLLISLNPSIKAKSKKLKQAPHLSLYKITYINYPEMFNHLAKIKIYESSKAKLSAYQPPNKSQTLTFLPYKEHSTLHSFQFAKSNLFFNNNKEILKTVKTIYHTHPIIFHSFLSKDVLSLNIINLLNTFEHITPLNKSPNSSNLISKYSNWINKQNVT